MLWIDKPEHDLNIEKTWQEFVRRQGGIVLSDRFGTSANFPNADFWFENENVIIELKEIQTEFIDKNKDKVSNLIDKEISKERLTFNDAINMKLSDEFFQEYIRLVRPAISRILKKANKQIKETRVYLKQPDAYGLAVIVNDGFTSFSFKIVAGLIANILQTSYSSIDGFILMTVNSYIAIEGSRTPVQMWLPSYSPNAENSYLPEFVNRIGNEWHEFLEEILGPSDSRQEIDSIKDLGTMRYMNRLGR